MRRRPGVAGVRRLAGGLAAGLACLPLVAGAAVVEQVMQLPVSVSDAFGKTVEQAITVTLFLDDAATAPRPLLVLNHGRAPQATERAAMGRARFPEASRWLVGQGFVVALPTRIGYGASGGPDLDDTGACERKDYPGGFRAAAAQVLAVIAALRARPEVDAQRAVVMGQSFGGATSTAVAELNPPGVVAAINIAGGAGGNPTGRPQQPCATPQLERLFAGWGAAARVPMLWLYTENDQYFGPAYPRQWHQAFTAAGGMAEFTQFTPHGSDGHLLFGRFPAVWQPVVAAFLRRQGFDLPETK